MEGREKDAPIEETAVMNTGDDTSPAADTGDGAAEAESERKKAPGAKTVAIVAAVALALAAACGVAAMGASQAQQHASEQEEKAVEEETDASDDEAVTVEVGIAETADAMDGSTSPTIVHFKGTSGDAEDVDFYHATAAKEAMLGTDSVELAEGTYEVEFLPTVNADGSVNDGTGDKTQDLTIDPSDDMERVVAIDSKTTAADKVTADQIAEVQKKTAEAVAKGDKTLTGDAGEKAAEKVAENAAKAPAADKDKIEKAKQEAVDAADKGSAAQTGTNSKGSTSQASQKADSGKTSSASSTPTAKKDTASTSKGSTSSKTEIKTDSSKGSSGSSSSSSQGGSTTKKECSHDWVVQTATKWVQDSAAYDEQVCTKEAFVERRVTGSKIYFPADGYTTTSKQDAANHGEALALSGKSDQYTTEEIVEYIDHPAEYKTVHHDATGHNETVTTGYRCSKCGETK